MSSSTPIPTAAASIQIVETNEPPSKSALKKAEKLLQLQAKKALKSTVSPVVIIQQGSSGSGSGSGTNKKKVVEKVVVVEMEFIEVPQGYKKS